MMNRLFRCFIYISIMVNASLSAHAFDPSDYVPRNPTESLSPNAKAFHRYGEIPVSLYTGTPNISIPLATLREGQLTLPVELSYHSGGIKVNEHPGWTGLGWNLSVGGVITREVRDIPDEDSKYGYFKNFQKHALDVMTSSTDIKIYIAPDSDAFRYDTEPDKFNFNFPGCSGFFMLDSKGEWQVYSDRPIKVTCGNISSINVKFNNGTKVSPSNPATFSSFILTADDGVEYVFGNNALDLSISCYNQHTDHWYADAWYLSEIRHPGGDKITFEYERGDFIVNFFNSNYFVGTSSYSYGVPPGRNSGGDLISPVYLSSIRASSFRVGFKRSNSKELNYTGDQYRDRRPEYVGSAGGTIFWPATNSLFEEINWSQLDCFFINDYNNIQVKRVVFYYSDDSKQRLTLKKIGIANREAIPTEWYSFSYNNIENLPPYLDFNVDHWGFFGCKTTIPTREDYREPLSGYAGYGVLTKIKYPTGGYTSFEYEPHQYGFIAIENESVSPLKIAGGVRIKRIINHPEDGTKPEIKTYSYSPGILEGKPIYEREFQIYDTKFVESSTFSLGNLTNNFGNHIAYPYVKEVLSDSSYIVNSFISPTELGFRDEQPMQSNDYLPFVIHSMKGHYRGKPTSISYYSSKGSLIKSIQYEYSPLNNKEKWIVGLYKSSSSIGSVNQHAPSLWTYKFSLYRNYYHQVVENSRTEKIWTPSGNESMVKTTYHKYNELGQLKRDSTVTIRLNTLRCDVVNYDYVWERNSAFASRHLLTYLSDVVSRFNGKTLAHVVNDYNLISGAPLLGSVRNLFDGSDSRTLYTCGSYTSNGFPVKVIDASGLTTIYLWGPHCLYPAAEIKNADIADVSRLLGYSPDQSPSDKELDAKIPLLRAGLPDAMITSYTSLPFVGITSITDPSGKTTYFDYDFSGRLVQVRDLDGNPVNQYFYNTYSGGSFGPVLSE